MMTYIKDGVLYTIPDLSEEELMEKKAQAQKLYFTQTPENVAIVNEIRKKYDINEEFAILRQRDEKPEEYQEYYNYCEQCKSYVREMRAIYNGN